MGEKSDEGGSAKAQQEENPKDDNYANFFFSRKKQNLSMHHSHTKRIREQKMELFVIAIQSKRALWVD